MKSEIANLPIYTYLLHSREGADRAPPGVQPQADLQHPAGTRGGALPQSGEGARCGCS